jgi:hypothetical protein
MTIVNAATQINQTAKGELKTIGTRAKVNTSREPSTNIAIANSGTVAKGALTPL